GNLGGCATDREFSDSAHTLFTMRNSLITGLVAVTLLAASAANAAKVETWTDFDGKKFKGEPTGLYGPFAFIKTSRTSTRGVRLRSMSPQDCVRFYEGLSTLPERADDW